jgi:biopolymer transport protein ExbD
MALKLPEAGAQPNHEPNVVPMIDILLVLLIIFMMQVPMSRKAMDVQVPPEQQGQSQGGPSNNIVLELTADGGYAINQDPVDKSQLDAEFHAIYDTRPAKLLFVKSAPNRRYQEVIEAMDVARGAGVQVIGFTPPDKTEDGEN